MNEISIYELLKLNNPTIIDIRDNYSYNDKISVNEKKKKRNKNGVSALKEIESLKCEIQNALKNNIVILNDIDEMRTNYYQREKDEEMFNAYETG